MFISRAGTCMPFSEIIVVVSRFRQSVEIYLVIVWRVRIVVILLVGMGKQTGQHGTPRWAAERCCTVGMCETGAFGSQFHEVGPHRYRTVFPLPMVICLMVILYKYDIGFL